MVRKREKRRDGNHTRRVRSSCLEVVQRDGTLKATSDMSTFFEKDEFNERYRSHHCKGLQ
jgi:hypothetical protein